MSQSTSIEWTDRTWNPIRGCSRVSEGCRNCYAEKIAARFSDEGQAFHGIARRRSNGESQWTGEVRLLEEHLKDPLSWRKPSRVFVNSMSDLFHEKLSDTDIGEVFGAMMEADRHTYQVLTKRAQRMHDFLKMYTKDGGPLAPAYHQTKLPYNNVWLGVSVENQAAADERIPLLLDAPAYVRFLSCEPLLGPVDLTPWLARSGEEGPDHQVSDRMGVRGRLHWVIVGGESGPSARPCNAEWITDIVAQCDFAGVPCFVKQMGQWIVGDEKHFRMANRWLFPDGSVWVPGVVGEHNRQRPKDAIAFSLFDRKGGDMAEWPEELRVREFPNIPTHRSTTDVDTSVGSDCVVLPVGGTRSTVQPCATAQEK